MSKTKATSQSPKPAKPARTSTAHVDATSVTAPDSEWLRPVSADAPCGPNLEYDAEYATLLTRLAPQSDAQYGDFIDKPEMPDWAEVERECRRLLIRSKDIPLLIWLTRCRTRLAGAQGLLEGLGMLAAIVRRYPHDVHPQHVIDGESDPVVRANALAALCDPQGLLGDLRDIVISANTALRLSVREVESAFAVPRQPEALPADGVHEQLDDLHQQDNAALKALAQAAAWLRELDQWARHDLGEDAPDLHALSKLLGLFEVASVATQGVPMTTAAPPAQSQPPAEEPGNPLPTPGMAQALPCISMPSVAHPSTATTIPVSFGPAPFQGTPQEQREHLRATLRAAQNWLEQYEPSSPVALLLKQAERLLGKRFAEVAQSIPPELLAKWEAD